VVGAALLHRGRLLAARRMRPAAARGRWELPGGKVEQGESLAGAAVREVHEELGCVVRVIEVLDGVEEIRTGVVLRVVVVALVSGEPAPQEHDALRWLRADQLEEVSWLDPDRPFLPVLGRTLGGPPR